MLSASTVALGAAGARLVPPDAGEELTTRRASLTLPSSNLVPNAASASSTLTPAAFLVGIARAEGRAEGPAECRAY